MKRLFSSTLAITFPEGVTLAFPLAGGVSRFLAWFVYVLAVAALGTAVAKTLRGFLQPRDLCIPARSRVG